MLRIVSCRRSSNSLLVMGIATSLSFVKECNSSEPAVSPIGPPPIVSDTLKRLVVSSPISKFPSSRTTASPIFRVLPDF